MATKRKSVTGKKNRHYAGILAAILVLCLVVVALVPWLTNVYTTWNRGEQWDNRPGDELPSVDNETEDGTINPADPNYELNITADRSYLINDASYLDYKPTYPNGETTENGEAYLGGSGLTVIVTNETGAPVEAASLTITAYASKTPDMVNIVFMAGAGAALGGMGGFAIAGPPGAAVGAIIGAIVGGISGWYFNEKVTNTQTTYDHETLTIDGGENQNELNIAFDSIYPERHLLIEMPEETLGYYSDFAVTSEISVNYDGSLIYVRLVNGDNKLLEIQREIKTDAAYQGMRTADRESQGYYDDAWAGYGGNDAFIGIDSANTTTEFYIPMVSTHDNEHVFAVHEVRMINVKDITGVDCHVYPYGDFAFGLFLYDTEKSYFLAPDNGITWTGASNLNNDTVFITGGGVDLETGGYYNIEFDYILSAPSEGLTSLMYVQYEAAGRQYVELLGQQLITFETSQYITEFQYNYNNYYADEQIIHRGVFDYNDRTQIYCDFNSPWYINETGGDFKFRFFNTVNGSNAIWPTSDGLYQNYLYIAILGNGIAYLTDTQDVKMGRDGISSATFSEDIEGAGIEPLKSYELRISAASELPTVWGATRIGTEYASCLYYILKNYNEFRDDIHNMDELINSLTDRSVVGAGTYEQARAILDIMKPKITDLEAALTAMRAEYPDDYKGIADKVETSIAYFKDYYVWLNAFMDKYPAEDVAGNGALFTQYKAFLCGARFWYADAFTQYNAYIAALNGETGISDDIANKTADARDQHSKRHAADANNDLSKYLPVMVLGFALIVAFILAMIFYYLAASKLKNKWAGAIITVALFLVSFYIIYLFLSRVSWAMLSWFYGA